MHHRLPAVSAPILTGRSNTVKSSENRRSVPSRAFSARSSSTDLYLKNRATGASEWRRQYLADSRRLRTDLSTEHVARESVFSPLSASERGVGGVRSDVRRDPKTSPPNPLSEAERGNRTPIDIRYEADTGSTCAPAATDRSRRTPAVSRKRDTNNRKTPAANAAGTSQNHTQPALPSARLTSRVRALMRLPSKTPIPDAVKVKIPWALARKCDGACRST